MLGVKNYTKKYLDLCKKRIAADLRAYKGMAASAKDQKAVDAFESAFFANMVLSLDYSFVHRLRMVEGKDGNPMNEVRVIATSILENDGRMGSDKTIKLVPADSILKYKEGDKIKISEADFARLSKAYFTDIERKFV